MSQKYIANNILKDVQVIVGMNAEVEAIETRLAFIIENMQMARMGRSRRAGGARVKRLRLLLSRIRPSDSRRAQS
ncbi:hypothetical protein D1122_14075 [Cereibacter sphaeroides]|nr:hypothetical protein D1122_14075 [Cereibacter sphaeroides]